LDPLPKVISDDPKFGDVLRHPLALKIGTSDTLARFRIFQKALPIIDNPPGVEFVIENSMPDAELLRR